MAFTLSVLACISSLIVINPILIGSVVTSVIYLITTFVIIALYLSLSHIVYIGLTYIIVYVGAVIVLFLFVIIIINLDQTLISNQSSSSSSQFLSKLWYSACATILFICLVDIESISRSGYVNSATVSETWTKSCSSDFTFKSLEETISQYQQIQSIGFTLYSSQCIWLLILSIILILAIIGPIVCCKNNSNDALSWLLQLVCRSIHY